MTTPGQVIGAGTAFAWLGMVLAISFLETPLKFQSPGITLPLDLGIGRLVFRALNTTELTLAAVLLAALFTYRPGIASWLLLALPEHCWPLRPGCCGHDLTDAPGRSSPGKPHPPHGC